MSGKAFLNHIAGLRGWAIIFVILFHLNSSAWPHGYLGVDVFLVITGYLLFRSRTAAPGHVSLREAGVFLARRLQRIIVPMAVLIILTLTAGLFFLWWPDEQFAGKLGLSACLGEANILLKREFEDYFASDSAFIPLLHLWYLSVTLQVYLLYAVANQALQRLPRAAVLTVLALLGGASLIYCYHAPIQEWLAALGLQLKEAKPVSYYQMLPRVWEVMAGGLVCVLPAGKKAWHATVCTVLGLLLILLPVLAGTVPGTAFIAQLPCTLLVVVGTVLSLRYAPAGHLRCLFENKLLVWLGGISFSLYLVHMPIIVFMRMWAFGEQSLLYSALIILVSLVAGIAFWYSVEKRRSPWWLVIVLWGGAMLYCWQSRRSEGFRESMPMSYWEQPAYRDWALCQDADLTRGMDKKKFPLFEGAFRFMNQLHNIPKHAQAPLLTMGDSSKKPTCILLGDSHAAHAYAGLDAALKQQGISGVYLASYIFSLRNSKKNKRSDTVDEASLYRWLTDHPQITHVIVGQRWLDRFHAHEVEQNTTALREFVKELIACGKRVVIIGPTPEFGPQSVLIHYDKIFALRHKSSAEAEAAASVCTRQQYLAMNRTVLPILEQMRADGLCTIIEPLAALEEGEVFRTLMGKTMLMADSHHLGVGQSVWLMQRLAHALRAQLQPAE